MGNLVGLILRIDDGHTKNVRATQSLRYDDSMREDAVALPAQRVDELALWCSVQELTAFHQDSPGETRRRELLKGANDLLANARYTGENWLLRYLPNGRRWERAMNLIREADPTH